MGETTELLHAAAAGDSHASERLFALLYGDLKRLAHSRLHRMGGVDGLNTTALVHEGVMRLLEGGSLAAVDRPLLFGYLGKVMRSVVIDAVRERCAHKRGGDASMVTLHTSIAGEAMDDERLLQLDAAMDKLARFAPNLHALVEMRYFAGLSMEELAATTGMSLRSVEREWAKARAMLRKLMAEG